MNAKFTETVHISKTKHPYRMEIISMEHMDAAALSILEKLIAENEGIVNIFIHGSNMPLTHGHDDAAEPIKFLIELLTTESQKQIPIILFEDPSNTWMLEHELRGLALTQNAYVIETKHDDPEPAVGGWDACIEMFKMLGMRKVIISGCYLYLYQKSEIRGCAHYAAFLLSKHFTIEISPYVNPGTPAMYAKHCGKFCPTDHKE